MKKIFFPIIILLFFINLSAIDFNSSQLYKWGGKDKVMHCVGSTFLTYWNYNFSRDILGQSHSESLIISISFTTVLGFAKESSDKHLKTTGFSWHDIAYDLAGIGLGMIIINNTRR